MGTPGPVDITASGRRGQQARCAHSSSHGILGFRVHYFSSAMHRNVGNLESEHHTIQIMCSKSKLQPHIQLQTSNCLNT